MTPAARGHDTALHRFISKAYPAERRLWDAWGWRIGSRAIDIRKVNIASAMVGRRLDQRRQIWRRTAARTRLVLVA